MRRLTSEEIHIPAARFMQALAVYLEEPVRLLI